ncbi:hypothetical protein [Nocardioides houyundeii]|uniref:hypothetical protein n=1 Tax=Nocardioides houyundeii TaxID=2045452 RepID=UPI000C76F871|nr:hypothetical protein [Nocardioides houyundeii]
MSRAPWLLHVLAAVLLAVVGAVSGAAAVLLHGNGWWALLLAYAAACCVLVALPPGWWARLPFAAGWVLALAYCMTPRPEGDFLIADGPKGYVLLLLGLVVGGWGVVSLSSGRRVRDLPDVGPSS